MAKEIIQDAELKDVNGGFFSPDAKKWLDKYEDTIESRAKKLGKRTSKRLDRRVLRDEYGFQFVDKKTLKEHLEKIGIDCSDLD